jgi:hypothetical protein
VRVGKALAQLYRPVIASFVKDYLVPDPPKGAATASRFGFSRAGSRTVSPGA